ncbi:MAG: right-handed parallel beta-helix repeat-containing protein, partial [Calditrichaeota bacterium]|nr:right-handed parallel beta-helix repeat-containing protein [Calditrichota bacterium]
MKNALPMKKNLFNPLVLWIVLLLLSGGFGLAQEKSLPMPAISAEPSRGLSTKGILLRPGTQQMQPLQPLQMKDWEAPSDQSAPRFVTFGKRGGTTPISPYAVGFIRYVKEIASGSGDGSDWNNATDNLQAMIDGASAGDQVWVAKGLYKPTPTTDRNIAFVMKDGVSIYGGFAGNEPSGYDLGLRDFDTNPTILSGDLQSNDGQQPVATDATTNTNTGDNSHTIFNASGVGAGTVIDGFTFTAGAADVPNPFPSPTARGAGIYMDGGELLVTNCRFSGNSASAIGGAGIYAIRGVLTVTHSTFSGNYGYNSVGIQGSRGNITSVMHCEFSGNSAAYVGAAMGLTGTNAVSYCNFTGNFANSSAGALHLDGPTTIDHSTFTGNYVAQQTSLDDAGGAVYVVDNSGSFLVMTACNFTDNRAVNGGALMAFAPVSISGCSFDGNSTKLSGGAVYLLNQLNSTPHSITNSTFTNNQAGDGVEFLGRGGGLYIQNAFAQINDCDFTGNRVLAEDRGQQEYYGGGGAVGIELAGGVYSATIENCRFIDNTAINCNGGAIYNIADNSTTFSGSLFQGNTATYWGGAVCNDQAIASISTSTFTENQALFGGGIFNWYSVSAVNQCDFVGNVANAGGGGMSIAYEQSNTVTNTIFRNNRASGTDGAGGALLIQGATTRITNTTIAGNSADYGGAVSVLLTGSNPEFINTIVYGNPTVNGAQFVFADGTPTATFSYTLLEEGDCYPEATCGPGMIYGQDPLFVSASDLHLQPGSPAINTGTNTGAPDSDIEGNPRPLTLADPADMGAYEAQPCAITGLTAGNQTACDPQTNTYTQEVTVTYAYQPTTGTLDVNGQSFAITASPQTVTLIDLVSDGQAVNVTASFSAEPACSLTTNALFTAPEACDALDICAEINPLIAEINALLNNPGTPRKSKSKLIKAKDYLNSACDNFTAGEYDRGFNDLADAADELDKAMDKGANADAVRIATV